MSCSLRRWARRCGRRTSRSRPGRACPTAGRGGQRVARGGRCPACCSISCASAWPGSASTVHAVTAWSENAQTSPDHLVPGQLLLLDRGAGPRRARRDGELRGDSASGPASSGLPCGRACRHRPAWEPVSPDHRSPGDHPAQAPLHEPQARSRVAEGDDAFLRPAGDGQR